MGDADRQRPYFYELNWFGKAVYLGGAALRLSAQLVDRSVERAAQIAEEAREAYRRELDPNIEDAKVIEEHIER